MESANKKDVENSPEKLDIEQPIDLNEILQNNQNSEAAKVQPQNEFLPSNDKQMQDSEIKDAQSSNKQRKKRRTKSEFDGKVFQCPDCDKNYLSGPALTTHRKLKHGYQCDNARGSRGRPKKEQGIPDKKPQQKGPDKSKFDNFFSQETRKPPSMDQFINDKTITLEIIKSDLAKIFKQCKGDLFKDIESIENTSFYFILTSNWDKETIELDKESRSSIKCSEIYEEKVKKENEKEQEKATEEEQKTQENQGGEKSTGNVKEEKEDNNLQNPLVQIPPIDSVLFEYLREFSRKTNVDYFWFIIKFVVIFREFLNLNNSKLIPAEDKSTNKEKYTEIYNAENMVNYCNDFYVDFMEPKGFYGLNSNELIELIQHFFYWLYEKKYTTYQLGTMNDN